MQDYILLMHNDARSMPTSEMWSGYISALRKQGVFEGGSSIGDGEVFRKEADAGADSSHLAGYMRIRAKDREHAKQLLAGNPVFESGGTVEIRELTAD